MIERPEAPPLILVNPAASRLTGRNRRDQIVADLEATVRARTGVVPEVAISATVEDARAWLGRAVDERRSLVVVAGGDGTVREAAHDLAGSGIALAIVPLGTANLFAASVGIALDPDRAIATIVGGRIRSVDLGRARWAGVDGAAEERVFAVACGVGFDARLMEATTAGAKRRLGRYGYFVTAIGMLGGVRAFHVTIDIDGERHELAAVEVIIANAGQLIPDLVKPALPIRISDGMLDLIVISAGGLAGATVGAIEAVARRSTGRSATGRSLRLLGARVRVDSSPAQPLEVDGDPVGTGWLEAMCLPAALRVVVAAPRRRASSPPSAQDSAR